MGCKYPVETELLKEYISQHFSHCKIKNLDVYQQVMNEYVTNYYILIKRMIEILYILI